MKSVLTYDQFEEIILNPEKYQDWNNILKHHSSVEFNLNLDEIQNLESDTNSVLFHFINVTGGKFCNSFYNEINVDKSPSYILFKQDFCDINNGSLIIDEETLENPFKKSYAKTFEKNAFVESDSLKGWKSIFNTMQFVSNSLIINDSYIFDNDEHKNKLGSTNIVEIVDAILPIELDIDYHILINTTTSKNKTNTFYDIFIPELIKNIQKLRQYKINVEIVIGEGLHDRDIYTNFLNINTGQGFKIFDSKSLSKILIHIRIAIETMFTRNNPSYGDTQYDQMKIQLKALRKLIKDSLDWINSANYNNTRCFYYSNFNRENKKIEIINRLLINE